MRMPATSVENIAKSMIKIFGDSSTKVNVIGSRPGEKLDEVLVSRNEAPFTRIIDDTYYVVLPQTKDSATYESYLNYESIETEEFNSRNAKQISSDELIRVLQKEKWLF
jgi:UDP-N-acetylglucosamine 4,6-dehydratase